MTGLHLACAQGSVDAVAWLLEHGADVAELDSSRSTPLHVAASSGHLDVCRLLVDAGADTEARDGRRATVLMASTCASVF